MKTTLLLMPTPLDFGDAVASDLALVMPHQSIERAAGTRVWVCENAKSLRAFLKRVGTLVPLAVPLQEMHITELPRQVHKKGDHGPQAGGFDAATFLKALPLEGCIGLASEAGMPCVADPGSSLVRAAHEMGWPVQVAAGPSALLMALAASGLNGQNFAFVGYVPQSEPERGQRLKALEALALKSGQTQIFIETPYRNAPLWQALLRTLAPTTRVGLGCGMGTQTASSACQTVTAWRKQPEPSALARPTVFLIGA